MPVDTSPVPVRVLLRGRFRWFLVGRGIDLAGSSMTPVTMSLAVLAASGSPTDLGIVLAAQMLPHLALLLLGGVVADRVSRRGLLITANLGSALTQAGVALVLLTGHYALALVAALALLSGCLDSFTSPALRGIVPELVAPAHLPQANALLASTQNATRILGPSIAGILVATVGGGWAIAADAASYAAAAFVFTRISDTGRPPRVARTLVRDLKDGWSVFTSLRWVMVMTGSFALLNAVNVGPWNVLGPLLVSHRSGSAAWGLILTIRAAGLLVMSLLLYRLAFRHPLRAGRLWGALGALPMLALALTSSPWVLGLAAFVGGVGFVVAGVTFDTAIQQQIPTESLSRVASYDDLFSYLAIPIGQLAVGPLSTAVGAAPLALACGIGYLIASLAPLASRDVRNLPASPSKHEHPDHTTPPTGSSL